LDNDISLAEMESSLGDEDDLPYGGDDGDEGESDTEHEPHELLEHRDGS